MKSSLRREGRQEGIERGIQIHMFCCIVEISAHHDPVVLE